MAATLLILRGAMPHAKSSPQEMVGATHVAATLRSLSGTMPDANSVPFGIVGAALVTARNVRHFWCFLRWQIVGGGGGIEKREGGGFLQKKCVKC